VVADVDNLLPYISPDQALLFEALCRLFPGCSPSEFPSQAFNRMATSLNEHSRALRVGLLRFCSVHGADYCIFILRLGNVWTQWRGGVDWEQSKPPAFNKGMMEGLDNDGKEERRRWTCHKVVPP
jgi:hypothetical protein